MRSVPGAIHVSALGVLSSAALARFSSRLSRKR
jgi:hypothetical protein